MKNFSLSELNRRPGELVDTAMLEPIALTKRGKPRLVLMSTAEYERLLTGSSGPTLEPKLEAVPEDVENPRSGPGKLSALMKGYVYR